MIWTVWAFSLNHLNYVWWWPSCWSSPSLFLGLFISLDCDHCSGLLVLSISISLVRNTKPFYHSIISSWIAPDVMIASFLILFTQLKFSWLWRFSLVTWPFPSLSWMWWSCLVSKEMNDDMIPSAYDLGASQFQMFKEIMLPCLTPSILQVIHGLHYVAGWLCRDLLWQQGSSFQPCQLRFTLVL